MRGALNRAGRRNNSYSWGNLLPVTTPQPHKEGGEGEGIQGGKKVFRFLRHQKEGGGHEQIIKYLMVIHKSCMGKQIKKSQRKGKGLNSGREELNVGVKGGGVYETDRKGRGGVEVHQHHIRSAALKGER